MCIFDIGVNCPFNTVSDKYMITVMIQKLNLLTFQLVIQVLQKDPDDLDHGQDQGAKSQGACVVSGQKPSISIKNKTLLLYILYKTSRSQTHASGKGCTRKYANINEAANRRARPSEEKMGKAGISSGFLKAQ